MVSMTSLCGGIHTISTNKREGNVHSLLRRVNKIALGFIRAIFVYFLSNGSNKNCSDEALPVVFFLLISREFS
ncbi:hypothetical protein RHMOL_Rhmol13G0175100 [Rhododendron molle]|uniref:Uncharacterized protein n=1 Tax=Rhododendron molle TaxID=49168 RepID=A0ACC0L990_RHOML|nr:hypothetical protein RHMOL_Rhmol13G0175100 [Rhododendron molle]